MIRAAFVIAALAAGLILTDELRAQPPGTIEVEVTDRGNPLTGIQISQFVNRVKTRKATTDGDGQATVPADALDFSPGETVSVWVRRCEDGRVELILVAEGEDDPCVDEEARAGEDCGCEKLGAFVWGGGSLVVDVGAGTVSFTPGPVTTTPPSWKDLFSTGFTVGATYWNKFEEISGQATGATASDATTWSPVVGAFAEVGIPRTGVRVGIAGQYSMLETRTAFGNRTQTGDVSFYGLGPYVRWEMGGDMSRTSPYVLGGGFYSWNNGDFEMEGEPPVHRVHKTWRGDVGGGVVHWITPRFGVWGEAHYSPRAGDNDADEHVRIQVGAAVRPMWDACGGSCIR